MLPADMPQPASAQATPPPTRTHNQRTLRVLFALPGLHRVQRGAEVAFESVAHALNQDPRFQVTLIGSGHPRPDSTYRFLHAACIARERFEHWPRVPALRSPFAWEELTFLPSMLRRFNPNLYDVTITCSFPYTHWGLRARRGKLFQPAHIFVTQNGDWPVRCQSSEYRFFHCDGLICTRPDYYQVHRSQWRSCLIPNGVDTARFHPGQGPRSQWRLPADAPVLLMVSALTASKRPLAGIAAAALLPDVHLVIAGDGPLRDQVDQIGSQLLGPRFHRLSLQAYEMPDLYRCADAVLHMSTDEPFGNVYLEALATGLPLVAHDTPTTRWITDAHAWLVDTADSSVVCNAIREALAASRSARTEAARAAVTQRFDWSRIAAQYAQFIEQVCRGA